MKLPVVAEPNNPHPANKKKTAMTPTANLFRLSFVSGILRMAPAALLRLASMNERKYERLYITTNL